LENCINNGTKPLIETKRDAIARRARIAMANLRKGMTRKGIVKELYRDLESDIRKK